MEEIKVIPIHDLEALYCMRRDAYPGLFPSDTSQEKEIHKLKNIQENHPFPFHGYYKKN